MGYSIFSADEVRATVWDKTGKMLPLPGFSAKDNSLAFAINDQGTVAGMTQACPVVWQYGRLLVLRDGGKGAALALSKNGVIGGTVEGRPALWRDAKANPELLPTPSGLSGEVWAVNDRRQAIGITHNNREAWPAYWENGKLQPLKALIPRGSNFTELFPRSVNEKGQLVGVGLTKSGELRGFVYTP